MRSEQFVVLVTAGTWTPSRFAIRLTAIVIWDNLNIHFDRKREREARSKARRGGRFEFVHPPLHASSVKRVEPWLSVLQRGPSSAPVGLKVEVSSPVETAMQKTNRRSRARIRASFMLRVIETERRTRPRRGDITPLGVFVEIDSDVGEPGEMRTLRLGSRDGEHLVDVQARLIRVVRADDLLGGARVCGAAFEFVLVNDTMAREVAALVAHLGAGQDDRSAVEHTPSGPTPVTVSVHTPWKLRRGERISLELPSETGGSLRVEGQVMDCRARKSGHFATRFHLEHAPTDGFEDRSISGVRAALRTRPPSELPRPHLSGDIARVSLSSLLTLASIEGLGGLLRLWAEGVEATVYLRDGRVIDAEGPMAKAPRGVIAELMEWPNACFELVVAPVEREDRLGSSTTALLLDLARLKDEAARQVA